MWSLTNLNDYFLAYNLVNLKLKLNLASCDFAYNMQIIQFSLIFAFQSLDLREEKKSC
jgi:hypothetical protein